MEDFMKKFIVVCCVLFLGIFLFGCQTSRAIVPEYPSSMQFSGADFEYGPILTATLRYDPNDTALHDNLKSAALTGSTWDLILFPRYHYEKKGAKETVTVFGRAARLKNR